MKRTLTYMTTASLLLSGCSMGSVGQSERAVEANTHEVTRYMDNARTPLQPEDVSSVRVVDTAFTSAVARRSDHGEPLPRQFESPGVSIISSTPLELFDIGTKITQVTGLPVDFAPDVYDPKTGAAATSNAGAGAGAAASRAQVAAPPSPNDLNSILSQMGLAAGNTSGAQNGMIHAVADTRSAMRLDYTGRLSGLLNQIGSHFSVSWSYNGSQIRIFRNVTRTYSLHALGSNIALTSSLNAAGSSSGSSGSGQSTSATSDGSNQKVQSDVSIKIWDDITKAVTSIVSSHGTVATAVSTGTIEVTAPSEVVDRVQTYIDGQNKRLSKQVAVSVQVLSVQLSNSDNNSLNVQGLFNQAARYGLTFGNAGTAATSMLTGTPGLGFTVLNSNGQLGGTNALISALSTKGKVSVRTTSSVTTLNGVPAPLQVTNTRGYLASVSTTNSGGANNVSSNTQTTLTPGQVTTGFNLVLLPRVNEDASGLLMQFGINISSLNGPQDGFRTFTSGGQTIQLPDINSRNFVQQAEIPNGATLVLAGFEQVNESATKSGAGSADFFALGGGQVGSRSREVLVILLTPTVLSNKVIETNY